MSNETRTNSAVAIVSLERLANEKGLIDKEGKELTAIDYGDIYSSYEGFISASKDDKYGFLNLFGQEVIPFIYEDARPFYEGLAAVKLNGKFGYINNKNEVIIDFKYEHAHQFSEDLAAVSLDDKYGVIDINGQLIIPHQYSYIRFFENGLSTFDKEVGLTKYGDPLEKSGIINSKGEELIEPIYEGISIKDKDYAIVRNNKLYGLLDIYNNEIVISLKYNFIHPFTKDLEIASREEKFNNRSITKFAFINRQNEIIFDNYSKAEPFKNGKAIISTDFKRPGFIRARSIFELKLPLKAGYNIIDNKGKMLLDGFYKKISAHDDFYLIEEEDKFYVLDEKLQPIGIEGDTIKYLGQGLFTIYYKKSRETSLVRSDGNILIEKKLYSIKTLLCENRLAVSLTRPIIYPHYGSQPRQKIGIMDLEGNWIVPPKYEMIYKLKDYSK